MRLIHEEKEEEREVFLHCPECGAAWAIDWPKDREGYFDVTGRSPSKSFETKCPSCGWPQVYPEREWNIILANGGTGIGISMHREKEGQDAPGEPVREGEAGGDAAAESEPSAEGGPPASE